jgi:hypothetical protein
MPWSGVGAVKESTNLEVKEMNKTVLKQKLLDAGLTEEAIDSRLKDVSEEKLKEFDGIPDAVLLKDLGVEEVPDEEGTKDEGTADDEQTFVLDETVLKEFAKIVDDKLTERLDGLTLDLGDPELSFKELPEFVQLQKDITELKEMLTKLTTADEERLKELNAETPRNGHLRVMRFKSKAKKVDPAVDDEEDAADNGDDEEVEGESPIKKKKEFVVIQGADGKKAKSMTEFVLGGAK